jgi:hypothetical protein
MYEELITRYLVGKDFQEFKNSILGMDKKAILDYVNQDIERLKREQDIERGNLENLNYDEITAVHDRMMGIEYRYTSLINLRHLLNEDK